jgi:hypothetical protein
MIVWRRHSKMQHRSGLSQLFRRTSESRLLSPRVVSKKGRNRLAAHRVGPPPDSPIFKAGDPVQESGIYETIHEHGHRKPHEVVMIKSDLFPPCDTCADRVCFKLIRSAPYIFSDLDFGQPE